MNNYQLGTYQIVNIVDANGGFDLYLQNIEDGSFLLQRFNFNEISTALLLFSFNLLSEIKLAKKYNTMLNRFVDLVVRNGNEPIAIVNGNTYQILSHDSTINNPAMNNANALDYNIQRAIHVGKLAR